MKKGISTIIATIILVVITIGLLATAYLYFAGIVTVGAVVAVGSGSCNGSHITLSLRNDGTSNLDLEAGDISIDGTTLVSDDYVGTSPACLAALSPQATGTCLIDSMGGTAFSSGTLYNLAVYGPRNTVPPSPITC